METVGFLTRLADLLDREMLSIGTISITPSAIMAIVLCVIVWRWAEKDRSG